MKILSKLLIGNESKIYKESVFWNMVAGIISASQSSIMIFFVIRMGGTYESGVLSIAFATAYLMLSIGLYGMRNFQVTDVHQMFEFKHYSGSRVITCILMIIFSLVFVLSKHYSFDKTIIVLSFCFTKMVDAIEDIFHGLYQQKNRLDVAGKAMSLRLLASTVYFLICYFITSDLVVTSITTSIFTLLAFIILNNAILPHFGKLEVSFNTGKIFRLFILCFPLFIASYLNIYISNAPKYAIDNLLTEEIQAYFGIIFTPVYIIKLLSSFIYRPQLTYLANECNNPDNSNFRIIVFKQIALIALITIIGSVLAYFCGTEILSFIYGQNMNPFRVEFVILLIGGGMTAMVDFINILLTIIREQKVLLISYIIVAILTMSQSKPVVFYYGIFGASILYTVMFTLMVIISTVFLIIKFRKNNKIKSKMR